MNSKPERLSGALSARIGMVLALSVIAGLVGLLAASCGDTPNNAAGDGTLKNNDPNACATPQMGCPCTAGSVVACGKKVSGDSNFIYCYQGKRECGPSGVYGDCVDGTIVPKSIDAAFPSETAGQIGQLIGQLSRLINDIRGEGPAPEGTIQDQKPGLLERADTLITNLNKVQ